MSLPLARFRTAAEPALYALSRLLAAAPPRKLLLQWLVRVLAVSVPAGIFLMRRTLELIYGSIQALPPTDRQLREENLKSNPLFRAFPTMKGSLAWRELGTFPTPVHRFTCNLPETGFAVQFWVKREDLSSEQYGGNKVRTLQYQLAACEAQIEQCPDLYGKPWKFLAFGSGGSNQVVATKMHAALMGIPAECVEALAPIPDEKEMDNTLNCLSAFSLPGLQVPYGTGMGRIISALWCSNWVFMPGGNGPLGVLGQAGAVLELAEQISSGVTPDLDGIVVAMGSNCTVTGLILGVALAREVESSAFRRPGFSIFGQPIHPGVVAMHRFTGFLTTESWPLTVGCGLKAAAALVAENGGPDVTAAALQVMRSEFVISTDPAITGAYGAHSKASLAAKEAYDATARAEDPVGAPHLWLCGHFTGKSFALLLQRLAKHNEAGEQKQLLFWQTKSAVQPLGPLDEWGPFEKQRSSNSKMAKWAVVGGRCGTGHPAAMASSAAGRFELGSERPVKSPSDYRALMTSVNFHSRT